MNNNNNPFYLNRIIKLISPLTCQTFKIELNGEENELRELLAAILEINPKEIKGLRDSYNNYYTLSSIIKNPNINNNPYNYYTVVIKEYMPSNNIKYLKYPTLNIFKDRANSITNESTFSHRSSMINKALNYFANDGETNDFNALYYKSRKLNTNRNYHHIQEFLNFADDLYKKNYIDHNLQRKLKKLIKENNIEVISILIPYLNIKTNKSFDELAKKIKPVITKRDSDSDDLEESKQNSSISSENIKSESSKNKSKKNKKRNNNKKPKKSIKKIKSKKMNKEEKILEDIKANFSKEKYTKLKDKLEKKDKDVVNAIKNFEKDNDYNRLLSKLSGVVLTGGSEDEDEEIENDIENKDASLDGKENDSSYYVKEDGNSKKNKKGKKHNSEELADISKNICNSLKNKGKVLYFIAKYDLQKLKNKEKVSLFKKQFKLNIDKISEDNYKIPKKNISNIKNYYTQYIQKKIFKNFNEEEKLVFERLLKEEDDKKNVLVKHFKDLLNHQNLNELKNQIKKAIKQAAERIEEEEGDEDDEENKGKIKEENEENENSEEEEKEEEEESDGEEEEEGEEDEDDQDEKESENKTNKSGSSNKDNFILKDGNRDRAVNILNNNYKKINNINNDNNKNDNNTDNNNDNNKNNNDKNNNEENNNLGLAFVVVKQKKVSNKIDNNDEEKKDSKTSLQKDKLNNTNSHAKESSQSTNNPNKKLNQFITAIEHLKKIDDIKKPIIDAVRGNNKYTMELFQKFQKNKFSLNPKSLYTVYKNIKDNPDTNSKDFIFRNLIKDITSIDENQKDFLLDEFLNKNSMLESLYSLYEETKEKDDFIESIEMFMKKPETKKALLKYSLKMINKEISPNLLRKNENDNTEDLVTKSKEVMRILQKYNLFNEKEYNFIMNSLENDDDLFTATFQVLFDDQELNEFYETMCLALENQKNWDNEIIKKNYKQLKKHIEEKHYDTLEDLFKSKNDTLYNILKDLSSSNINQKIENVKTLILKRELSAT